MFEHLRYEVQRHRWLARTDVPVAPWTTLRIGGIAPWVLWPRDLEEAVAILETLTRQDIPWRVLGGGSNVLVPDTGSLPWVIVKLDRLRQVRTVDGVVQAGAGVPAPKLCMWAARRGLGGLEFMSGIPGQVGGLVWMNAGAFGRSVADVLAAAWVWEPGLATVVQVLPASAEFGYRKSPFQARRSVILQAAFRVEAQPPEAIRAVLQEMKRYRLQTQPLQDRSAGCAFKNPTDGPGSAGQLIERVGLKGYRIGGAMISPKHANFIVNTGSAAWSDVVRLIEYARARVWEQLHVWLEPEIEIWHGSPPRGTNPPIVGGPDGSGGASPCGS
ncbi:MAG: UDP-N-acetylmuramate dehydrogenase [Acidobacteria bacterium]|nr:UDP-N-acetylmuramate dehydrogenase [Acidobacteriota bacterium]MDW7984435.1 UDP-N-acetylmuramate dehydrogenase [Acidobacteriota bacterium]